MLIANLLSGGGLITVFYSAYYLLPSIVILQQAAAIPVVVFAKVLLGEYEQSPDLILKSQTRQKLRQRMLAISACLAVLAVKYSSIQSFRSSHHFLKVRESV